MATADSGKMPLLEHFRELRKRLILASISILLSSSVGWIFYTKIIGLLTRPVCNLDLARVSTSSSSSSNCGVLYIDGVLGPLNLQITVALVSGIFIASPFWIFQLWAFIAPALNRRERNRSIAFIIIATPFFLSGAYLAYWLLPVAMKVLLGFTPHSLTNLVKFSDYLTFVLHLILVFALAFELPVFLVALNSIGILSGKSILKPWRLAVFCITFFSAAFIPTSDPFTMAVLAIPLIGFYFGAAGIAILNDRRRLRKAS